MKQLIPRIKSTRLIFALLLACAMLLSCGLAAIAAEEGSPDLAQAAAPPTAATPLPVTQGDMPKGLYPTDVQTVILDGARQIIKTYTLTAGQDPAGIPRDNFTRDGWRYELTDITEKRTNETDTKGHTETVEISTETKDLNEIIKLLAPTLDYQGEDGYCGLLALDLSSVSCEAAGYTNSSYTATSTREYPHLSNADTSLIPKAITDNGRTLTLDSVSWETQRYNNVDYEDIPESYRAVAQYSAKASRSVVTGYVTTAGYIGEVSRTAAGDTVYTVYFSGSEIGPAPKLVELPIVEHNSAFPVVLFLIVLAAILALLAGAGAYWYLLRHNVKVYKDIDGKRTLVAKDKISVKKALIDLSPLDGYYFIIEIDKYAAKALNSHRVEIRHDATSQKHKIAYEGNAYTIEADFVAGTVQAIY